MSNPESSKQSKQAARKLVTLNTRIDKALEVVLTGDFTGWAKDKVRLTKGKNGGWAGTIELLPGKYEYRLLVDGEWRDDPDAKARVANSFGTENCVLTIT